MIEDVLAQPQQIGDALWRVEAAGIVPRDLPGGLVICGMGGSAVGGDLAAAAIGGRARRAIRTVRGYELPPDVGPETLVLCASYSGSTEETLACFDAAGEAGAPRVALTTGGPLAERARAAGVPVAGIPSGMQPRAAVVYMTIGALECAALCGAVPSLRGEIEGAREVLEELAEDSGADSIARALEDTIPIVHGAGPTVAIARRWKTQLNENSKLPAFASELPEANHNEIEGWRRGLDLAPLAALFLHSPELHPRRWKTQLNENSKLPAFASELPEANHNEIEGWRRGLDLAPLAALFLHSPELHPRLERRMELTAERLSDLGAPVVRVDARGDTPVAHVLALVMAGDLVSVSLAELEDIDPTPVAAIEGFKAALGS